MATIARPTTGANPMTFTQLVAGELAAAREKYPQQHASLYESYAVLKFEFDEVETEIKSHYRCGSRLLVELAQLAATCQRAAEDAGLVECTEGEIS